MPPLSLPRKNRSTASAVVHFNKIDRLGDRIVNLMDRASRPLRWREVVEMLPATEAEVMAACWRLIERGDIIFEEAGRGQH